MVKNEDSAHKSDHHVPNFRKWVKRLTIILTSVLLLTMFGLGGYWLGARQQQPSRPHFLTKPKASWLPSATPVKQRSSSPTITTRQSDPTSNWKIYRNTKIGFELKYPPSYQTPYTPVKGGLGSSKTVDGSEDNTSISFDQLSTNELGVERILLVMFPYSSTLDDMVKNAPINPYFDYDHPTLKFKETMIDGNRAYWFITTDEHDGKQRDMEIFFIGKNHGFILQTGLTHNHQEIERILSTFRFIR
jgi:hypothetical protein